MKGGGENRYNWQSRSGLPAPQPIERRLDAVRQEHVVRHLRDLLRPAPPAPQRALRQMPRPNGLHLSFRSANARDDGFRATLNQHPPDLAERPCEASDRDPDDRAARYRPTDPREASAGNDNLPRTAT